MLADAQKEDRSATTKADVLATIGGSQPRPWWRGPPALWLIAAAALVLGVVLWMLRSGTPAGPHYQSVAVRQADLRSTVTATGNLESLDQVEVGAELSGRVAAVYVDYNESVEKGQLLCELDPRQWQAALDQARAQLRVSRAELGSAEATLEEARTTARRTESLAGRGLSSPQTLEAAVASRARAEAAQRMAAAQVALAQANLAAAQDSLGKTRIVAPIDGVVLSRTVETGQTVAAAFQAPVLFTLARDLKSMELLVDIDEADVGQVAAGQAATFTVDAYPERTFAARLVSIHNLPATTDNVVTYEGVLEVRNDDLVLRPGMTATVTIVTAERPDALLVPNAALRFSPPSEISRDSGPRLFSRSEPAERENPQQPGSAARVPGQATVWTLRSGQPQPVVLRGGLTDGQWTEVLEVREGELVPGTEVLVDVEVAQ